MQINIGLDGEIVFINLAGNLVASTAEQLKKQVATLLGKNFRYIMLEMGNISFMDSSGLGACMAIHKIISEKDGMLVFIEPGESISKIFRITGAYGKLYFVPNKKEALKALNEKILANRSE